MKLEAYKLFAIVALVSSSGAIAKQPTGFGESKYTQLTPSAEASTWERETQVAPMYPIELAQKGMAGCGIFKVDIDENGKVDDIEVVEAVPKSKYFKSVKKQIKSWNWVNTSGKANTPEQKVIRLDFCLAKGNQENAAAQCELQAAKPCSL